MGICKVNVATDLKIPFSDAIRALTERRITHSAGNQNVSTAGPLFAFSLGAEGPIVGYQGNLYKVILPNVKAVNPVGSGDAYAAGMAAAQVRGYSMEQSIQLACGRTGRANTRGKIQYAE